MQARARHSLVVTASVTINPDIKKVLQCRQLSCHLCHIGGGQPIHLMHIGGGHTIRSMPAPQDVEKVVDTISTADIKGKVSPARM